MPCVEPVPFRTHAGFSLIEMLVAMSIFGLAVLALLHLAGESTRSAALVEERVLAGVVADNRAAEALLAAPDQLQAAATEGTELAGDRRWHWQRRIATTDMDGIVRVDITVTAADGGHVAAEASAFRGLQ